MHGKKARREHMLRGPEEFARVMRGRRKTVAPLELRFVCQTGPGRTLDTAAALGPRLGLIIAKKVLPRAVDRNAVRRVLREAFCHHFRVETAPKETEIIFRLLSKPSCLAISRASFKREIALSAKTLLSGVGGRTSTGRT